MRYLRWFLLVFLCCSPALSAQSPEAGPSGKPTDKADYSSQSFVVEVSRTSYRFENDGTGTREIYARIKVQSEAGVQQWGQVVIGYNSENEQVQISYVRVHKADGSIVTAPADAVQDLSSPMAQEAPVYTDYRQKHITVPALRPGEVLEYQIETVMNKPLAPGQFWMQYDFAKHGIVLDEELELNIPSGRNVKLKTATGKDPVISEENGRKIYRWKSAHLEDDEDKSDDDKDKKKKKKPSEPEPPAVQMTTFTSWAEMGEWYAGLEKDRRQPTPEIRAKAAELTAGKTTDLEKIQALYDYVAKNFRYVSLSFGVGRYQPHAAESVLHNQYGDCKDKHTLLASLLEAEGFHASSALINSSRKLDPDLPSPYQFDHVITMVPLPNDEVWMDTTTEIAPFRLLSFNLRKKQALVIPASGTPHLEETPANPPMPSLQVEDIEGTVNDSGKLEATVHFTSRGDAELLMRTIFRRVPNARWKQLAESISASGGMRGKVAEIHAGDPGETTKPFEFTYKISSSDYLDWTQKKIQLALPFSGMDLPPAPDDDDSATDPIKLGAPGEQLYHLKLTFPEKYTLRSPVSFSVKRDYAEYQASYQLNGHVLTADRKMVLRERELPQSRAGDYRSFEQSLTADVAQTVGLESTAMASGPPPGLTADELNDKGVDAMRNSDYKLAVELLKKAVELEPKHKSAWNNLGRAYFSDRQYDPAIAAYKKQIEINPYDQYAFNNLGLAYLQQQKYDEAVSAFQKQIEMNPLDKWAHANLGATYIQQHKYAEAVPELEKATSLRLDDAELQVTLGTAYLNTGENDKAQAAFEKAVQISASPITWNNIAFELTKKNAKLDLAQQYAESAVASTAAASRNLNLAQLTMQGPGITESLAAYWDTLGWVYFARGNMEKAEQYVKAAWTVSGHGEVGDHLGQIYQKMGRKDDAAHLFALAANGSHPIPESTEHLMALEGSSDAASKLVQQNKDGIMQLRTVKLGKVAKGAGTADFFVLLASSGTGSVVEDVKWISGDEALKAAGESLKTAKFEQRFPDEKPARILRRGTLTCSASGDCDFVMQLSGEVTSVQ